MAFPLGLALTILFASFSSAYSLPGSVHTLSGTTRTFSSNTHALSGGIPMLPGISTCPDSCDSIPIKFPFGTEPGCGHPDFAGYLKCIAGKLQFSTGTGVYDVTSIDYSDDALFLSDPLMSTCSTMQNSGSFTLNPASPFRTTADDVFVLLGCSTSSPLFDPNEDLCDPGASNVCSTLYSCKGVAGIGLEPNAPSSTCCVYQLPLGGLNSAYELNLPKLQCSSYTCVYGFGDDEEDASGWKYGISLRFNGSYNSAQCKDCEASGGACGFTGSAKTFSCICQNGENSTTTCYGKGYVWSGSWSQLRYSWTNVIGILPWFWMWLFV